MNLWKTPRLPKIKPFSSPQSQNHFCAEIVEYFCIVKTLENCLFKVEILLKKKCKNFLGKIFLNFRWKSPAAVHV